MLLRLPAAVVALFLLLTLVLASCSPNGPDVTLTPPSDRNRVSSFLNVRVADIQARYEEWRSKGAEFVTPPIDRGAEIRCYMRDPDGYLIEVGQGLHFFQEHDDHCLAVGLVVVIADPERLTASKHSPVSQRSVFGRLGGLLGGFP